MCFHLEWSPDAFSIDDIVKAITIGTQCRYFIRLMPGSPPPFKQLQTLLPLTDCRCNLSEGEEPDDPKHLAYQYACLELVKALVSDLVDLAERDSEDNKHNPSHIVGNLTGSILLLHCHLDSELLSLCLTFFELAKSLSGLTMEAELGEARRKKLLKWIETFPDRFTEEAEVLKAHVLTLPWGEWGAQWKSDRQLVIYRGGSEEPQKATTVEDLDWDFDPYVRR
ncbi:hypothetical protein PM082_020944 [Marasmius tenuissimus]|nr:hypothetical protein PM082_020944 [Marasmius tenuissimus]